ncbi:MAG: chemotaxis protein CheX [Desulfuromonadaceae bacterium]
MLPVSSGGGTHTAARFTVEELSSFVITSTRDAFSTMVMMELRDESPLTESVHHFHDSISGVVSFTGIYTGALSIHCPFSLARTITANMLGMESEEIDDDVNDALGEIANLLGGGVKHLLPTSGRDVKLSTPTVISGESYMVKSIPNSNIVVIPFYHGEERFLVGLTLTREDT